MAGAGLSIKLRCTSWQQLATIYRRDLSRGTMFLKASTQPPIGTRVRIDLELPSASVIELEGGIVKHVVDPQRGTGVELKLEPLPTKSVWMIESALAAENKVRAERAAAPEATAREASEPVRRLEEGDDVVAAEVELLKALDAEAESLRKLNPFLVLGVGYEAGDAEVRAAFGELTKRYHPDRFARYQSPKLRQTAAEIFILIRDAYRRLADPAAREQALAAIGAGPASRPTVPLPPSPPRVAVPSKPGPPPPPPPPAPPAKAAGPHDAPTNPSAKSAQLANTVLAKGDELAVPVVGRDSQADVRTLKPAQPTPVPAAARKPTGQLPPLANPAPVSGTADDGEAAQLEALIDEEKYDEALAGFRKLVKKHPQDRVFRAHIELLEGLRSLVMRDRMEAAQRFEAALEIDPSNERAARQLAEMRRMATNERKGLLSRLMGKREPPA